MRVVFESFGHTQINRKLMRLEEHALDPRPAYRFMAKDFYEWEKELFETEGRSGREAWAQLAPSTLRHKAKHGFPLAILHRTGDLRNSLTSRHSKGSYALFTRRGFEIGSRLPYAQFHYDGTKHMPARLPVQLTEAQRLEWMKIFQKWMMMTLEERGFR
jgi:phage gpG-like protein